MTKGFERLLKEHRKKEVAKPPKAVKKTPAKSPAKESNFNKILKKTKGRTVSTLMTRNTPTEQESKEIKQSNSKMYESSKVKKGYK